jgi:hypothetical protein
MIGGFALPVAIYAAAIGAARLAAPRSVSYKSLFAPANPTEMGGLEPLHSEPVDAVHRNCRSVEPGI